MYRIALLTAVFLAVEAPSEHGALPAPKHGVYVVAHRGAHEGIPENTLAAYQRAIELGADFVEIDARQTKDGHFVSIHNSRIDDYVLDGAQGAVRDFTLAELKALDIGSRTGPEWKGERIPTVTEIFALCKGRCGIYLDFKEGSAEAMVELVREAGMESSVLWYASPGTLRRVKKHCPECILMPDPGTEKDLPRLLDEFKPGVVAAVWRHFSEGFVATCHAAGARVIVDEDTPECWEDAVAWGTDGIQTDHPAELVAWIERRASGER